MKKLVKSIIITFAALFMIGTASAQFTIPRHTGWLPATGCGNGYAHCESLTLDHTQAGGANSTNWPLAVRDTDANLKTVANGGYVKNSNGYDIIYTSDSTCGSPLNSQTEVYTASSGLVVYWVKIPTLSSSTNTVIYRCYGNSSITTDQSTPTSVWDSNFLIVNHFGTSSTLSLADSTSHGNNLTNVGATAAAGLINGAASITGSGNRMTFASGQTGDGQFTISQWVKTTTGGIIFDQFNASSPTLGGRVAYYCPNSSVFQVLTYGGENDYSPGSLLDGNWHNITVTYSGVSGGGFTGGSEITYLDGVPLSRTGGNPYTSAMVLTTGGYVGSNTDGATLPLGGPIDELEYSTTARSSAWVVATVNSQKPSSTFYSVTTIH